MTEEEFKTEQETLEKEHRSWKIQSRVKMALFSLLVLSGLLIFTSL